MFGLGSLWMGRTSIPPCCGWHSVDARKPMLVTDAMPPVGGQSPYFTLNGEEMEARGHACWRKDGVLAGTALDMASAVRNCVRLLGHAAANGARPCINRTREIPWR